MLVVPVKVGEHLNVMKANVLANFLSNVTHRGIMQYHREKQDLHNPYESCTQLSDRREIRHFLTKCSSHNKQLFLILLRRGKDTEVGNGGGKETPSLSHFRHFYL